MYLTNLNAEIVACILLFRKSHHKPNLESTSKYGFPPDLSYSGLSFRPPGFSPYRVAGRKESPGTGLVHMLVNESMSQ